jgi:hypothetical protein
MGSTVVALSFGRPSEPASATGFQDGPATGIPILLAMALVVMLGVYNPPELVEGLNRAARFLTTVQ